MFDRLKNLFRRSIFVQKLACFISWVLGNKLFYGKWHDIKVWANAEDAERYRAGDLTVQPLFCLPDQRNGITDEGIHYVLEVAFRDGDAPDPAQIAAWFAGLINDASFTGVAAGDTMASHAGWIETHTTYDEATRVADAFTAAAARAITSSFAFTMNDSVTVRGIFITSVNTKGGTTGTLFSTALFASPPTLVAGNVLTANYSLTD